MNEVTFRVWAPRGHQKFGNFFPMKRFYVCEADGEFIQFSPVEIERGGGRDAGIEYEITATGEIAEKALETVKAKVINEAIEIEKEIRKATVNSKTRVLGKKGLRDDFKGALKVAA